MRELKDRVIEFVRGNMSKSVRSPEDSAGLLRFPYTVPSAGEGFRNFFYWDTYFANWALYALNMENQARNNLKNMADLIAKYGYMPNADVLTNRSQPPLFIRGVYEYCENTSDREFGREMLDAMRTEYEFWMRERMAECGLNRYGASVKECDKENICAFNREISERLALGCDGCRNSELHLLACAESGWDFSSRFFDDGVNCRALDICPVDLNAILYDAELKLGAFEREFGNEARAETLEKNAAVRRKLMRDCMYDGRVYRDCDATLGAPREGALHAGSFFAAAFGVDAHRGVKELADALITDYGLLTCARNEHCARFQWDYPMMWPPLVGIAEKALTEAGEYKTAQKLREVYTHTVERVFGQTENLWEKYNAASCDVGRSAEYRTPPMLGWTAGVYLRFTEIQNQKGEIV